MLYPQEYRQLFLIRVEAPILIFTVDGSLISSTNQGPVQ